MGEPSHTPNIAADAVIGEVAPHHGREMPMLVADLATISWHYDAVWVGGNHPISLPGGYQLLPNDKAEALPD